MTVTATYLDDLGRVRVEFTGAPATADYAIVERSRDQVRWEVIRGGNRVAITDGAGRADDYEYHPNEVNYYRVTYVDAADVMFVGAGPAAHADNADVTPELPTGLEDGDVLSLLVSMGGTGSAATPDGWTLYSDAYPLYLFQRVYDSSVTAPTVVTSGGSAGDPVSAVIIAHRNARPVPVSIAQTGDDTATSTVMIPQFYLSNPADEVVTLMWRASEMTGFTAPPNYDVIGVYSSTLGTARAMGVMHVPGGSDVTVIPMQEVPVSGGSPAISRSLTYSLRRRDYVSRETTSITPAHDGFWLKNLRRPNLNRKVTLTNFSDITRPGRSGVFDVIGRTLPVAVTELQGSRRVTIEVMTRTLADANELDHVLASGEVLLLQGDGPHCPVPTMYAVIGDIVQSRRSARAERRFFSLPVTEVARPDLALFVGTVSWQDVVNTFVTWEDVMNAEPTWDDVTSIVADSDVIVE